MCLKTESWLVIKTRSVEAQRSSSNSVANSFLKVSVVSAIEPHSSRKFPDFLKVDSQNRIKDRPTWIYRHFYVLKAAWFHDLSKLAEDFSIALGQGVAFPFPRHAVKSWSSFARTAVTSGRFFQSTQLLASTDTDQCGKPKRLMLKVNDKRSYCGFSVGERNFSWHSEC